MFAAAPVACIIPLECI